MRVLFLITDFYMGGAEIQVLRLCHAMKELGYCVSCVSLIEKSENDLSSQLDQIGIPCITLGMKRGKFSLVSLFIFYKIFRSFRPNIIHSHMVHANFFLRFVSIFFHSALLINTIHGEEEFLGYRPLIYRLSDSLIDKTVCCSNALAKQALHCKAVSRRNLLVIRNGLNTNKFFPDEKKRISLRQDYNYTPECFVWMTVGRLDQVKNQTYMLKEFKKLNTNKNHARLIIVGSGPDEYMLKQLAFDLDLKDKVIFTGKLIDVSDILNVADAFVLSSIHEGLPLSLQEAAATGLPLVSTDVGGCDEIVIQSVNGYLCKSNAEGALCDAMLKLMNLDHRTLVKMKLASRKRVLEYYNMDKIVGEWNSLYLH